MTDFNFLYKRILIYQKKLPYYLAGLICLIYSRISLAVRNGD